MGVNHTVENTANNVVVHFIAPNNTHCVVYSQKLGPKQALLIFNISSDKFEEHINEGDGVYTFAEMEELIEKKGWNILTIYNYGDELKYQLV